MTRGDIILCRFPHASGSPAKMRPALIVQSDFYNGRIANVLVASITGNLINSTDPAHYVVDVTTEDGAQTGLTRSSLVSCINLAVIPKRFIDAKIGKLPGQAMQRIDECLRVAMSL